MRIERLPRKRVGEKTPHRSAALSRRWLGRRDVATRHANRIAKQATRMHQRGRCRKPWCDVGQTRRAFRATRDTGGR
jgi:hypothetical protein